MSTKTSDNFTFHELFRMGAFTVPTKEQQTRSGRISKRPERFRDQNYTKGSGCCQRREMDSTDMSYDGSHHNPEDNYE
ncbi:Hypothetical protein HVR_LOCUS770 [uncultured virus]|nr:Hypothetical protein HVR_LOCUS770 [uncultured virus]